MFHCSSEEPVESSSPRRQQGLGDSKLGSPTRVWLGLTISQDLLEDLDYSLLDPTVSQTPHAPRRIWIDTSYSRATQEGSENQRR